ncbi:hypothetical protein DEIPH_ctg031orf0025 [Deinococcus phoenicis]|uniref:Uncharacterized protein n=1 Tax=Deinococcus phoenicis TaxID=1476583 RepID=A0A016QPR0_9DEIO|nr:hypothetical protein [Deinococcus phoenicis]EYB67887.1 hypothetical protein DEIPH_ctg031orf0025 [Deinococcus phoenicis]
MSGAAATGIAWLDLRVADDPHPRRFDSAGTLRAYLIRIERLPDDVITRLLERGEVGPPDTRRVYRVQPLRP